MKKILVCILLFTNCTISKTYLKPLSNSFDIQGHRGCRGLMPENTIAAFIKAIELGVTALEMDVVITKDNEVLVSHDPYFNHLITTKPNGNFVEEKEEKQLNIYAMSFAETQQYDVGKKPHPKFLQQQKLAATKPLLKTVIDSVEAYIQLHHLPAVQYNIETKCKPSTDNIFHPEPAKFVDLLMTVIIEKKIENRVIIQSFDVRTLQYLHQKIASIKTAYLFEGITTKPLAERLQTLGFTPTIYSPAYQLVTKKQIEYCHKNGIQIIPWTVNDSTKIKQLKAWGVDGIISDYPNLAISEK